MIEYIKRTWVEVSLDNLAHNYNVIRQKMPEGSRFLGVVKADAYGHGAVPVSRMLEELGAEYLAVSDLEEAVQIRRGGVNLPILILGYTPPEYATLLAEQNFVQEINFLDYGKQLQQQLLGTGLRLKTHVKLDTGMSRLGFFAYDHPETVEEIRALAGMEHLILEGVFAHFSVADSTKPDDVAYTKLQYTRFCEMLDQLAAEGITFSIRHHANSAAIMQYPEYALDMVRSGIATYGLFPSAALRGCMDLKPVFSLHTAIAQIKPFAADIPVSYDRIYTTPSPRSIAVIPVGYADGLMRRLSENTTLLLHGKRVPIVGRICMDLCMIDVTDVPEAKVGDTVTIIGENGGEINTCDTLADIAGTIPYEILCGISKRVPRLYFRNGKQVDLLRYIV
jgi:alanine racemase